MDKIYISDMEFYSYHGVLPEENRLGQRFYVDLVLHTSLQAAGESDDLSKTVNYADAYAEIKTIMDGEPVQLIETLAERIAQRMLSLYPMVRQAQVKVTKPSPPFPGPLTGVAVEVIRER